MTFGCEAVSEQEPQALGLTYWLDTPASGDPYPVKIRFTGRRVGVRGKPRPRDSFSVTESIDEIVPGSGPVSITTHVPDISSGRWQVTASAESPRLRAESPRSRTRSAGSIAAPPAGLPKGSATGVTGFAPIMKIRAPGARLGVWPALVGIGAIVGVTVQAILASHVGLSVSRVLVLSIVACLVGLIGAKLYYLTGHFVARRFLHRDEPRQPILGAGMCIQGFVLGAIGTLVIGAQATGLPIGLLLDVTVPGLLFGMTIGRFGCFFGGCCSGRPTASRWGLWSSDRHIGARRIPVQLLESSAAFLVGLTALLLVWRTTPDPAGAVFVGAIATYTLVRQLLFPLRSGPRHTAHGRRLTMALTGLVIIADLAVVAFVR